MEWRMSYSAKVLIAAGGTGGHVFPALAIARSLAQEGHRLEWIGSNRGLEGRVVPAAGIAFKELNFSGVRGRGLFAWLSLPVRLARAVSECWSWLGRISPQLVIVFGGYVSFPVGIVARMKGIPLLVHEQNAVMGTANRWLSRFATRVIVSFPSTRYAPQKALTIGNPVREELRALRRERKQTKTEGPRGDSTRRLLVLGGSLGARPLNQAMPKLLSLLKEAGMPVQILHQTGLAALDETRQAYLDAGLAPDDGAINVVGFIDDMAEAYRWSDLVICRAGASTVSELMAVGCPAVLIPLPHAIDDHQTTNANALVGLGAAEVVVQSEALAAHLAEVVQRLGTQRLSEMARGLQSIDPDRVVNDFLAVCRELIARETFSGGAPA
jgi:UDP-N-acetylglucosamine--N-acetylmuramyl-(pentapeptide) pyrophosphoryl-undecaprenol N-acetylglucosamine transferase